MSLVRPVLNAWLRWTEKPFLRRAKTPAVLRSAFEIKARLFFHGPWSVKFRDTVLAGRPALEISRKKHADETVALYFHGGAYVFGSPRTHSAMIGTLCAEAEIRAILPDYRKAPEHPFPAAIEDAKAAWLALLDTGVDPKNALIGGDSAGGGLCLSLLGVLLDEGLPLPAGVFAFSPLTDLTFSGDSIRTNADKEVVLPASRVDETAHMYLNGADPTDPRASPLFAKFDGAPPIWLSVGDTEILFSDTDRLTERLSEAMVTYETWVMPDLPHVWPLFHNILPEARQTLRDLAWWIRQQTGRQGGN